MERFDAKNGSPRFRGSVEEEDEGAGRDVGHVISAFILKRAAVLLFFCYSFPRKFSTFRVSAFQDFQIPPG